LRGHCEGLEGLRGERRLRSRFLGRDLCSYGVESEFRNGKEGGIPPMFFKECASGFGSTGCGRVENESVQVIERIGFTDLRECAEVARGSKREVEFTSEHSVRRSRCQ
jgi:hypothetical protein